VDVMVLEDTWGRPLFASEHENSLHLPQIQYDAWKLLALDTDIRVLVAYFGRPGAGDRGVLTQHVREVVNDHWRDPKKGRHLLSADWRGNPRNADETLKLFECSYIGPGQAPPVQSGPAADGK